MWCVCGLIEDYLRFTNKLTHSAVRTYRIISSVPLLILRVLSHGRNISFYFADASARTSSDTATTWCVCGLKRFGEHFEDYLHFTNKLTHSAVRTYRIISSVSLLILQVLSHGPNICFYFADTSARTSSDTASTWCVCGKRSTGWTFFNS